MREPIASTLDPLTESQVNAYRRLPGSFGEMLQAAYNDGWNGCHAHMKGALIESDLERDRYREALENIESMAVMGTAIHTIAHNALKG